MLYYIISASSLDIALRQSVYQLLNHKNGKNTTNPKIKNITILYSSFCCVCFTILIHLILHSIIQTRHLFGEYNSTSRYLDDLIGLEALCFFGGSGGPALIRNPIA